MHPKYHCLEKSRAHSKLSFTSSNGSVGGRQMLNQLKSSPDSDPINVSLQRPHYYRHKCRHHHHDYHHYHTIWLNVAIIIIWRPWSYQLLPWTQSPSYLQSFPKNVTLYSIKVNFELVGWKKRVKKIYLYNPVMWSKARKNWTVFVMFNQLLVPGDVLWGK